MKNMLFTVCVLVLISCGNQEGSGGDNVITLFVNESLPDYPKDGTVFGDQVEEATGLDLVWQTNAGGDGTARVGTMIASGDYPDVIYPGVSYMDFISADALIPLEDLIEEHYPSIKEFYGDYWNQLFHEGHIYVLPALVPHVVEGAPARGRFPSQSWWIQAAVLKDAGYPEITTLEEYFSIIGAYQKKHPEINGKSTIGFEPLVDSWYKWWLYSAFLQMAGYPVDGSGMVDLVNGQWEISYYGGEPIEKNFFRQLNQAYLDGVFNGEAFTTNIDIYKENLASGRVLGIFESDWLFNDVQQLLIEESPERMFLPLRIVAENAPRDGYIPPPVLQVNQGLGISINANNPLDVLKIVDYVIKEENQKIRFWGYEGEHYLVNEEGRFYRTPEQRSFVNDRNFKTTHLGTAYFGFFPYWDGFYSNGNSTVPASQREEIDLTLTSIEKETLNAYGIKSFIDLYDPGETARLAYYPMWNMVIPSGSEASILGTQISDVRAKYIPQLVLAPLGDYDNVFEEYKTALDKFDKTLYLETYQEQIDLRQENW